jgi:hypothetical protein
VILSAALAAVLVMAVCAGAPVSAGELRWQGKPAPACRYFLVTEFGLGANMSDPAHTGRAAQVSTEMLLYDLGVMVNVGERAAAGGTVSFKAMYETRLGLFGRYRRWLGDMWALDLSPGIIVAGSSNDDAYRLVYPAAAGRIGIMYGDWIGVGVSGELVRMADEKSEFDWYADIRVGYYPGAVLGTLMAVLGLLAASTMVVSQF